MRVYETLLSYQCDTCGRKADPEKIIIMMAECPKGWAEVSGKIEVKNSSAHTCPICWETMQGSIKQEPDA